MSRFKKKHRNQGGVQLSLTAMLDMAFQLLAFFVLTFKSPPLEGEISLRMPPPQPVTAKKTNERAGSKDKPDVMVGLETLAISVLSNKSGGLGTMAVNDTPVGNLASLDRQLKAQLGDAASPFEQVIIQVGSGVRYDALMSVVDICTRQRLADGKPLTKLSFVELPDGS